MSAEPFITGPELARILGVHPSTVSRMMRDGMPSYVFCRRSRRYLASECVAWARGRGSVPSNVIPFRSRRIG